MAWFHQLAGTATLESAEDFFEFFQLPYEPQQLRSVAIIVLREFRQQLQQAVPLRQSLTAVADSDWHLARRLLAESYQRVRQRSAP
ncbi:nitrogenase-stabilizing/protective protein NifW [Pantoea sp. B65]|uniref:nitrogenase-stabilizing/protective protein NifW n=1 Tax=Pantoea sp. B65 TaxID=2813359 RepID=UPI0039B3B33F